MAHFSSAFRQFLLCSLAHLLSFSFLFPLATAVAAPTVQGPGPSTELQSLGFTLLQATPIEFELEDPSGKKHALQDYRGKWIFLAFWATWCGPCNMEIPALDAIYRKFGEGGGRGMTVVAVSVDTDVASVRAFVHDKSISFPVLHDAQGTVSSQYKASALPTLYVISPDWKLVAVMQGARDWRAPEAEASVAQLIKFHDYKDTDAGIKMVAEDSGLSLPNNLVPPQIEVSMANKVWKKGESGEATVLVSWKSNPKEYLIKVPKLTVPEGVSLGEASSSSTSSSSSSKDGDNEGTTLSYHFPIKFEKEGSLKIGPVELAYSPRTGGKELFSRNEGVTVEVKKAELGWMFAPGLLGVAFIAAMALVLKQRQSKLAVAASGVGNQRDWSEPFEKVRQLKMKGQRQEYMAALLKLTLDVDAATGVVNPIVVSLLEKLKFGGVSLSETELSSYEKKIERAIKEST